MPLAPEALAILATARGLDRDLVFPGRKRDNFGRLLCDVFVGEMDVGEEMIRRGHAVPYVPRR